MGGKATIILLALWMMNLNESEILRHAKSAQ